MERYKSIWRFNPITGLWVHVRKVTPDTEKEWLLIFKNDEPLIEFKVSRNKPMNKG